MSDSAYPGPLLFLSHSGSDTEAARSLKRRIEEAPVARERGLKVWFDKDHLRAGEPWQPQLEEAIERRATAFAVYVGGRGVINWVEAEVRLGLSRAVAGNGQRFPFIPILAPGANTSSSLPGFALQFQGVHDVETNPDEFRKLIAAVLGDGEAGLRELEKEPFFGLKAIDETRSHLFFGRERETQELIERLSDARLLMVTGDSGSGKSSLVRAGLVPRWRGGALAELKGKRPDQEIWHVIETRPGINPRRALGDAVFAAAGRLGKSAADCGTCKGWVMSGGVERIRDGLRCGLDAGRTRTLVVVDQFEELLTVAPEEHRQPYVDLMLALSDPKDNAFAVVLTMRRDYYNLCSEFPPLYDRLEANGRRARYLLGRMQDNDLRRVITEPLNLAGVDKGVREALARNVLLDVGERPGDLALVQFALTTTWQHRKEYAGDLLQSYSALGRVEGALAQAADQVYADLLGGDANESEIAAVFLRLVRLGDTGGATRRIARRREFSKQRWRILQALADEKGNRLIQIGGPEGDERVEIAHEALVTQWPRFQRWLQTAAGDKRTLDRLIERAAVWAATEMPANPLSRSSIGKVQYFATGAELQLFEDLMKGHRPWLSSDEIAYVDASAEAHRREEIRSQWLFRAVAAASVLFAMAAAAALLFYWSAAEQTRTAVANETRALTALSGIAIADDRPNEAAQLALAAWPRSDRDQRPRLETTLQNLSKALSTERLYLRQWRHDRVVSAVATKDGTRFLSWSKDGTMRLWDVATGRQIGPAMKHDAAVWGAVLTKDGTRILSWSDDRTLRLWDAATGRQIGPAMRHDNRVSGAVLTKDETRILSWSADGTLRLWDAATGRQTGPAMKHDAAVWGAVLTKDGTRILSWSADGTLRLWDAATGRQIGPAMKHDNWVSGAVLTKDETRILSWSFDGTLRLWDAATGRQTGPAMKHDAAFSVQVVAAPLGVAVSGAALTKDETRILSWSDDGALRLWDAATGRQIGPAMKHDNAVFGAVLMKDEMRILSWSLDGTLRLWDAATGDQIGPAMKHDTAVWGAVLTKDETRTLSWSADGTLRLWDAATGQQIGLAMKHDGSVSGAMLRKDETRILSWSENGTLRLWDAATGQQIGPAMKHDNRVSGAVLTKDETHILSWSDDGTLRLWDAATGQQTGPAMKHDDAVNGAALTTNERRILSWSDDRTLRLWDAATGRQIGPAMKHDNRVSGAVLTKDETRILSWSFDGTLRLWDAATGRQIGPAMKHDAAVWGAVLTKDGTRILSWSDDRTLRLWDAATGRQIGPAMRHDNRVSGAVLTKDETRILSWSADGTLRLWDAATGRQTGPAMKHDAAVWGAVLTKDGTRILSWSADGTLRLWDAATGRQIGPAMKHDNWVSGAVLTKDETRILSWSFDGTLRLWDAATGRQTGPAMKHDAAFSVQVVAAPLGVAVSGAALTKDETRILSWSDDGALRLWDAATGRQIGPAMKHDNAVFGAVLMKDEMRILSWSLDGTLRLWDAATGDQIGPAMKHYPAVSGAVLTKDETRILSWSADGTLRLWGAGWPKGNLLEIACAILDDHDANIAAGHYGVIIKDRICSPATATLVPDWSLIERAPAAADR